MGVLRILGSHTFAFELAYADLALADRYDSWHVGAKAAWSYRLRHRVR